MAAPVPSVSPDPKGTPMTPYKRVSNAIDTLRREINAAHPGRSKISDGTLGDTALAAATTVSQMKTRALVLDDLRARQLTALGNPAL